MMRSLRLLTVLLLSGAVCVAAGSPVSAGETYEEWKQNDPDAAQEWLDEVKKLKPGKTEQQLIDEYNKANEPEPPPSGNPNTGE